MLSYIYLLAALFFALSQILFYNRILFFGIEAAALPANVIKIILILIPFYLFLELPRLKPPAFYLAVSFQGFFIINALLMLTEKYLSFGYPVLRVSGIFGTQGYSFRQAVVICLNIALNFAIIMYIINQRKLFFLKGDGK